MRQRQFLLFAASACLVAACSSSGGDVPGPTPQPDAGHDATVDAPPPLKPTPHDGGVDADAGPAPKACNVRPGATPLAVDPTYHASSVDITGGKPIQGILATVDAKGRLVIVANGAVNANGPRVVARLTEDGDLDGSFGQGGIATIGQIEVSQLATDAEGRIVLAGAAQPGSYVARLDAFGGNDATFNGGVPVMLNGNGGTALDTVSWLRVSGDAIFVAPLFEHAAYELGGDGTVLAKIPLDGTRGAFTAAPPNILYAGGASVLEITAVEQPVASFGQGGAAAFPFPAGQGNTAVDDIVPDGRGAFFAVAPGNVARFSADGVWDTTFGSGGVASFMATGVFLGPFAMRCDGALVAVGYTDTGAPVGSASLVVDPSGKASLHTTSADAMYAGTPSVDPLNGTTVIARAAPGDTSVKLLRLSP